MQWCTANAFLCSLRATTVKKRVSLFWAANLFVHRFCELRHSGFSPLCPWQSLPFGLALLFVPRQSESLGCRVPGGKGCQLLALVRRPDGSVGMALVLPALTDCRWWFESLLVHSGVSSTTRRKATGADHKNVSYWCW